MRQQMRGNPRGIDAAPGRNAAAGPALQPKPEYFANPGFANKFV